MAAAHAACVPRALLAHRFVDEPYNRCNLTLVSRHAAALAAATLALAREALRLVDLRTHTATHPRLGALDHVSVHPLLADADAADVERAAEGLAAAAALAGAIAQQLGEGLQLPSYLYGAAHADGRPLADLRRSLGYFKGAAASCWQGPLQLPAAVSCSTAVAELPVPPDFGPRVASPAAGVCCVGAAPFITNYNVLLRTSDLATARRIAHALSERGGGLPAVQTMALAHDAGVEVACNLLDGRRASPAGVLARLRELAAGEDVEVAGEGYITGEVPANAVPSRARPQLLPHCHPWTIYPDTRQELS